MLWFFLFVFWDRMSLHCITALKGRYPDCGEPGYSYSCEGKVPWFQWGMVSRQECTYPATLQESGYSSALLHSAKRVSQQSCLFLLCSIPPREFPSRDIHCFSALAKVVASLDQAAKGETPQKCSSLLLLEWKLLLWATPLREFPSRSVHCSTLVKV